MTHWNDMINRTAVLRVENVAFANQGIYSASYVGDSPLQGAWMRLIVRGLLDSDREKHTHTHTAIFQLHERHILPLELYYLIGDLTKHRGRYNGGDSLHKIHATISQPRNIKAIFKKKKLVLGSHRIHPVHSR